MSSASTESTNVTSANLLEDYQSDLSVTADLIGQDTPLLKLPCNERC
jgi:hypothetical protein